MIEIVISKRDHIQPIAKNMRMEDRAEIKRFNPRMTSIRSLNQCFEKSLVGWTVLKDGVPIAMFGACEPYCMAEEGIIFLLGTDEVKKHAREFILCSKTYISKMLESFKCLSNRIDGNNQLAVRFAKKLLKLMPNNVNLKKGDLGLDIEIRR